jgi:glycosyltransferase involved in cell wall biosynthesis
LLDLERRHDPDIVHLNSYGHAARSFRSPVVITAHGCACAWWRAVYRAQAPALYDRYRDLVRKGLQGAQIVIAPSVAAWDSIELEHGGHPTVYVVPHGLSPESFGREDKLPFVLCAAREWDEAKNLQLVDRAMPDLMWPVHVGDGLERPELLRWMQTASVFLHPAKYEPFGYTVLEAALSGCALLLADIPSLNEIWGPTALYFNPDSASELTQKANLLVEHPELRRGMAARAHERALELSVDQMVDAHLGIYREAWSKVTASSSLSR